MNLDFSPQDVAFRQEVRDFIAAEYPAALRETLAADRGLPPWGGASVGSGSQGGGSSPA